MKKNMLVNALCISLAVSSCSSTKVSYFVEPFEGARIDLNDGDRFNLKSNETQSSGSGWALLAGLVLIGLVAKSASCRPGQYRPVIGGYGGLYWDGGNC